MEIIKKTLVVLVLCSFIVGTVPISVLAQQNSPDNQIFEYKGPNLPDGVEYVPGEFIVEFKPGVSNREIANINSKHGTSVKYTSPYAGFKILQIPKSKTVPEMVEKYNRNPNVEYAVVNSIAHAFMVPNDPLYELQWHLDNDKYGGINMEAAWDISNGTGVIVAVLDTGVAYEDFEMYQQAPDLANTHFTDGWDFVNDDAHPNDDDSHGTHVTGTIAQSTNNQEGVAGVAYNCTIMPVKVLNESGSGTLQQLVDGIYYATDNGAKVISMSLGWYPGYYPGDSLITALDHAYENGVTIVCASGNDRMGIISYPAAYEKCIAVGATTYDEKRAVYSNYGDGLDIMAPGGYVYTDKNRDGYGDGVLQNTFNPITKDPTDFGYWFFHGTSMATPHVSGVAALLIANGVTGPDNVREALISTAEDKGSAGWDPYYGYGIVDAHAALNYVSATNEPPTANANGPYSGTEDAPVDFDGSGSSDSDGDALTYHWDYGDDSTGTGVNPTHAYTAGGEYIVTLIVNDGKVDSEPSTATATITEVNDLPVADAGANKATSVGDEVTFDGSGSYDPEGTTLSYAWNFGEGSTGTGESPTHTYTAVGTYTVTLTVNDEGGLTDTDTLIVTVTDEPIDIMHIASIDMSLKTAGPNKNGIALVTIVDVSGDPVAGATVQGHWSDLTNDRDSSLTDASGEVKLNSDKVRNALSGTKFTFTVDSVALDGWTYDIANSEISDSITV